MNGLREKQRTGARREDHAARKLFAAWSCLVAIGCGGGVEIDPAQELKTELRTLWRGEDYHVAITGQIGGKQIDLLLEGELAQPVYGPNKRRPLEVHRKYCVPDANDPSTWSQGKINALELRVRDEQGSTVIADAIGAGYDRAEFRFYNNDLQLPSAVGSVFEIAPKSTRLRPSQVSFEGAIDDKFQPPGVPALPAVLSAYAQAGEFLLIAWAGDPSSAGFPSTEGIVAGVVRARWSTEDALTISFTTKAGDENQIQDASTQDRCANVTFD